MKASASNEKAFFFNLDFLPSANDPKRKESLRKAGRKADQKRAEDPKRRETTRAAKKKYAQTEFGKYAKMLAQERYQEKLGITRRREQFRKYK